jgi:hypothetical protein
MRSSRTDKGMPHSTHVCLCECVQEPAMWQSHIGAVESMQRVGPYRLGVSLQNTHSVAK